MDSKENFLRDMEADKVINSAVIKSMVGGAIPIPLLDIAATTAVQVGMIKKLCGLYGVEYSGKESSALISSLASSFGAKFGASIVKSIPFIGGILGAPVMITLSGVLTYATGKAFTQYVKANSSVKAFREFDLTDLTNKIKENLNEGAKHVKKQVGDTFNVDIEQKLKDISTKAKSKNSSAEEKKEATNEALSLIMAKVDSVFEDDNNAEIWLNNKNKLSGNKTPQQFIDEDKYEEVGQWLDILLNMKSTSYLDKA